MLTVKRQVISIHLIQSLKTSTCFGQAGIRAVYQHSTSGMILKIVGFRMKQCIGVMNHCETIDSVDIGCGACTVVNIYGKSNRAVYRTCSEIIDASAVRGIVDRMGERVQGCAVLVLNGQLPKYRREGVGDANIRQ